MSHTSIECYQLHQESFHRYQALLLKWNQKINLTAITDAAEIIERHFLDSLSLLDVSRETFFPDGVPQRFLSVLDIGSGGGFPGIPLKIALPSIEMTLVDSIKKRCDFLKEVVRSLQLNQITVLHEALKGQAIGCFDVIVTRATFSLAEYLPLAIPNLKPKGLILAMKGLEIDEEIEEAKTILSDFQLQPFEPLLYQLPHSKLKRQVLMTRR